MNDNCRELIAKASVLSPPHPAPGARALRMAGGGERPAGASRAAVTAREVGCGRGGRVFWVAQHGCDSGGSQRTNHRGG